MSSVRPLPRCTLPADVEKLKKSNKRITKQVSMIMKLFRSDDKMSQMLTQLDSQPEFGSGSGSGGCGDDEPGDDEDGGEDEEDADSSELLYMGIAETKKNCRIIPGDMSPGIAETKNNGRLISGDMSPRMGVTKRQNSYLALTSQH
ncbi:hypothetical protein Tco_0607043 [Tanacetum coccineum]